MERTEVYKLIDGERAYQDGDRKNIQQDFVEDKDKSPEAFILYIEKCLNDAKKHAYDLHINMIQDSIRKIAGLAVASMEAFGAPERQMVSKKQ